MSACRDCDCACAMGGPRRPCACDCHVPAPAVYAPRLPERLPLGSGQTRLAPRGAVWLLRELLAEISGRQLVIPAWSPVLCGCGLSHGPPLKPMPALGDCLGLLRRAWSSSQTAGEDLALSCLEEAGMVLTDRADGSDLPSTAKYAVTCRGAAALRAWEMS